jgi:hypothetical protein
VLEVFGSGGAIWGFSEAMGLRTSETDGFWRPVALSVGCIFFVRFVRQIKESLAEERYDTEERGLGMKEFHNRETSPLFVASRRASTGRRSSII